MEAQRKKCSSTVKEEEESTIKPDSKVDGGGSLKRINEEARLEEKIAWKMKR
jgi:hypothetical protein